jgi:hypothetical protein
MGPSRPDLGPRAASVAMLSRGDNSGSELSLAQYVEERRVLRGVLSSMQVAGGPWHYDYDGEVFWRQRCEKIGRLPSPAGRVGGVQRYR